MWGYAYNGFEQLSLRTLTVGGSDLTHFVHDIFGNVIAETSGTAATTLREYLWLPEAEIAPTFQAKTQVDRPLAMVEGVSSGSPQLWWVHVDHLNRPVKMTNTAKAAVWDAVWTPWGSPHSITGSATLNARFPGQWFQLEAGLHYNWHRHYDPTIGRYTQPDPLGFVDGPSVYGYARGMPGTMVDPDGRNTIVLGPPQITIPATIIMICINIINEMAKPKRKKNDQCEKLLGKDEAICDGFVKIRYGLQGRAICMSSAMQRYSECLSRGPSGVSTPLAGFETPL